MRRLSGARLSSLLTRTAELTSLLSKPRLRFCVRVTVSAVLAFATTQFLTIPLHGLWAVLTAVVVTQMSIGASLKATADYAIGTISGAVYASAVAALAPHPTAATVAGVLALAIAPLAYAAAVNPSFRVAPFTAVIVLMVASQLGEAPIESGFYRLLEVAIGGAVAVTVSLLVFPSRAHALTLDAAARVLEQLARAMPQLFAGATTQVDPLENRRIQDDIGQAVSAFETVAAEAKHERSINLGAEPDPAVLGRTLLRLRHDLVIVGRACIVPLPNKIAERLGQPLVQIGAAASDFLLATAGALTSRRGPPPVDSLESALTAYTSEIAAVRGAGLMQALPSSDLERIFTVGFTLNQFHQDFSELARCAQEWARRQT
jgi:uncharacterized membrane protein YccC